ncbi:ion channel [Paraburkholderia phosphatilytica]|uniref:ion channel n=1 Tax=Paraburkholderia phosphatilytica TaxID=2282883 RepID=UPI000E4F1AD2|nr:ion channel [Paraburkholderia phosphatilytica]
MAVNDPIDESQAVFQRTTRHGVAQIQAGSRKIIVHGLPEHRFGDLYHAALNVSWPLFFSSLGALFLLLNTVFAVLFQLGAAPIANQFPQGFLGAFFFSVETLATVGYGDMHPQTLYAHVIATLEIFVGMSSIALATGLIFARFSRPRAKIMFARYAVVHPVEGRRTLMVRAANERQNVISEARARLRLLRVETSAEGYTLRKLHDLTLVRDQHPIFQLGWNLMHVIDEASPLFGETAESLDRCRAMLLLTIEGSDETTSQTMTARYAWKVGNVRWHHRYVDLMYEEDGVEHIDYHNFDEVIALDEATPSPGPTPSAQGVF